MSLLTRIVVCVLGAAVCSGAILWVGRGAFAQSDIATRRLTTPVRSTAVVHPTPPPLPVNATVTAGAAPVPIPADHLIPAGADAHRTLANSRFFHTAGLAPLPGKAPKLSSVFKQYKGRRAPLAASGATIMLTGDQTNFYLNDQTLPYNAQVFFLCQNMAPNTTYRYVLYPPTQGAVTSASVTTTNAGTCGTNYFVENLATPIGVGSDPSYPGVWTVAMERITPGGAHIAWDSVAYFVVISTLHFNTFADPGFSSIATDYQPGSTAFMSASGLTPNHTYAFGVAFTGADPLNCVFEQPTLGVLPAGGGTCFPSPPTGGNTPFNGSFSASWPIPNAATTGTYSAQLYDTTSQDLVSTQQISVQPASASFTLQPFSGITTNTGVNLGNTFATDGIVQANGAVVAEQSVTGLNVNVALAAPGFIAGHTYSLTMSDPNGAVLTNSALDNQHFGPTQTFTANGLTAQQSILFPNNTANFTGIGPTLTAFAPNVFTLQIFDRTANSILASKSFNVLAYQAQYQWSTPAGESVTANAAGFNATTTVSNIAPGTYGAWNGDGIKQFTIAPDTGNNVTIALNGASANDSTGQSWNFTMAGTSLVANPAATGQFLPPNATLNVPMTLRVPAGRCIAAVCVLQTSITPFHGIAASANNVASNGLQVYGTGAVPGSTNPSYSWVVGAGPGTLGTPRYAQVMYRQGTEGVNAGNYAVNVDVSACGAVQNIEELKFTMPAAFDADVVGQAPTLAGVTLNGAVVTGNWFLYTRAVSGGRGSSLQQNEFAVGCTNGPANRVNGCGIPFATAAGCGNANKAVIALSWPIPTVAFPIQQVTATANYQGGCVNACGMPQFNVGPVQQLTNTVVGTSNVDSTEFGFFSLQGSTMTGVFNPQTVGQGAVPSTQPVFEFTNTSPTADSYPDFIDEIQLDIPNGALPNSVTPPVNWFQNGAAVNDTSGTGKVFTFSVCNAAVPPCNIAAPSFPAGNEPNALAPGATIGFRLNYTAAPFPAAATYAIGWTAHGANGGGFTSPAITAPLTFANTVAQVSFDDVGGGDGTPTGPITPVGTNAQATVGSDFDPGYGNSFVIDLLNNGTQVITGAKITLPVDDVNANKPTDTAHDWQVSGVSVYAGSGGAGCNGPIAAVVLPNTASNTPGSITLTGCTAAPGTHIRVFFRSSAPYDQPNHFYRFNGTVSSALQANAPTQTLYQNSDTMLVIPDAQLRVYIPTSTTSIPDGNGLTFNNTSCPACTFVAAPATIDLGTFAGSANFANIINAAVTSDQTGSHGWQLFLGISGTTGSASGVITTRLNQANVSKFASYTPSLSATTFTAIPLTNPGLLVGSVSGASTFSHAAVANPMDFSLTLPAFPAGVAAGTDSITLTYTLIPN